MSDILRPTERRSPVTYILGNPVDQSDFFDLMPPDDFVENYLNKPGFELSQLQPDDTLVIVGRNPNQQPEQGEAEFFDQTMWLRCDEQGQLIGQFLPIGNRLGDEVHQPEEFTIGALHSSIDYQDRLSEAGNQRVKLGYFLQGENLTFQDGACASRITLVGRIVSYELLTVPNL